MTKELHSLGTVVYLDEGTQKVMIVGRGVIYHDETEGKEMFVDYMGCTYPAGIDPNNTIFFNQENIDKVIFEGYKDDEEERFSQVYENWEKEVKVPRKIIN